MPWRNMAFVEQLHDVIGVEVNGEFRLRLTFDDGTVGEVDFAGREWRGVFEPLYAEARQNSSRAAAAGH